MIADATSSSPLAALVGQAHVKTDDTSRLSYGTDALKRGKSADFVVLPGSTEEVAAVVRVCAAQRIPIVPRGAGTGYTGGAVPTHGGVVISLERMNRILEIDEANLVAVVQPHVITGDLQDAVEKLGLFYPPDPASLRQSVIGGNVAECAGGPRAFKYGTTKRYVLGLEAVLPTGEVIRTGGKVVKNVVGYDLTQLLVGSEGTLAIITEIILRLVPKPPVQSTLRATFPDVESAVAAVTNIIRARVVPAALELIDGDSLEAVARNLNVRSLAPEGTAAILLLEVDGIAQAVAEEAARVEEACRAAGATEVLRGARRGRAPGAVARAPRALAVAEDDHAAQVQPRRGRAEGTHPGAVRARAARSRSGTACGFRASATRATATSMSTSWSTRRTPTRSRARTSPKESSLRASSRSKARSAGSTGSASRRRRSSRSSCRRRRSRS